MGLGNIMIVLPAASSRAVDACALFSREDISS